MGNDTKTKHRPILFSGPMVRAILDGRKTQTRRVVKWPPRGIGNPCLRSLPGETTWWPHTTDGVKVALESRPLSCPYGKPGDRLWVRETWAARWEYDDCSPRNIHELAGDHPPVSKPQPIFYKADGDKTAYSARGRWRPSIHMPRWASRLTLEVTDVRVERVQDISRNDVWAEGVYEDIRSWKSAAPATLERHWIGLWDSINAKRGYSWESNPWVWVVTFEVSR